MWDFKQKKRALCLQEKMLNGIPSSVIGIHPLLDDNYFVCSAFNSRVSLEK